MPRYSNDELLDEIHRLAAALGHPPTLQEAREHAEFGATTFYQRFGSWRKALAAAGYEPRDPQSEVSDDALLAELRRVADEVGERPTVTQMSEHGAYSPSAYRNHFGSWITALEAAGFEPPEAAPRPGQGGGIQPAFDQETLLADLKRLGEDLGKRPTWDEMLDQGPHSPATYQRRFGSWAAALEAAGFDSPTLSRDELVADLQALAEDLGHIPSKREMSAEGEHSPTTYDDRFGSWSAAVAAAFDDEDVTTST